MSRVSAPPSGTLTADVVVIGAGPAGIACSVRASELGARVVLLDRAQEPGGQIWRHRRGVRLHGGARRWLERLTKSGTVFLGDTSVTDISRSRDGFVIAAESFGSSMIVNTSRIVLATGARELFIPFEGWTLPGVMGIGGAQALLKSGASFSGKRVAIAGSGPLMFPVAVAMRSAGARVVLLAEQASAASMALFVAGLFRTPSILLKAAAYRTRLIGINHSMGTWVRSAQGTHHVESVNITDGRRDWREDVDVLCTGYGLVPNIELAQLLGCVTDGGRVVVNAMQRTSISKVFAAGEVTCVGGAPMAITEGEIAAFAAFDPTRIPRALQARRVALNEAANRMNKTFAPRPELRRLTTDATLVCRCEDVSYGAVRACSSARQARLYTRAGMGACQGRTCMPSLELLLGWQSTGVRSPVEPTLVRNLVNEGASNAPLTTFSHSTLEESTQ